MPTENENKVQNLIDVGEEDQKETEINLDEKGEPEKVETPAEEKIEVEQVEESSEDKTFENERETKLEKKEEPHAKRLDENNIKEVENQLPEPVGYRILVLPFTPKEKTKGGILFSQEQLDKARIATTCGYVL